MSRVPGFPGLFIYIFFPSHRFCIFRVSDKRYWRYLWLTFKKTGQSSRECARNMNEMNGVDPRERKSLESTHNKPVGKFICLQSVGFSLSKKSSKSEAFHKTGPGKRPWGFIGSHWKLKSLLTSGKKKREKGMQNVKNGPSLSQVKTCFYVHFL